MIVYPHPISTVTHALCVVFTDIPCFGTCRDARAAVPERRILVQLRARPADVVFIVSERATGNARFAS